MIKNVTNTNKLIDTISEIGSVIFANLLKYAFIGTGILFMVKLIFNNINWLNVFIPLFTWIVGMIVYVITVITFGYLYNQMGNNFYVYCKSTDEVINSELEAVRFFSKRKLMNKRVATKLAKEKTTIDKQFTIEENKTMSFDL